MLLQYLLATANLGFRAYAGPMWGLELDCTAHSFATPEETRKRIKIPASCPFDQNLGGSPWCWAGLSMCRSIASC